MDDQEIRAHIQAVYDGIGDEDRYIGEPYSWELGHRLGGYEAIIGLCVDEVVTSERFGDYQGDAYVLVRMGDAYGFLTYGYGSCSGCDWYEGTSSVDGFVEMTIALRDQTHWEPSADALYDWLQERDWPGQYSWHEAWEAQARAAILSTLEGKMAT